ncbi:MAG: gamma-glutamylcyclotransferase [Aestuariivirga sp.]|jgi:cation transport protein ChaC
MAFDYHPDAKLADDAGDCRHVFAYGSLIWNPGFEFVERNMAKLTGYHRSLCVYSNHYRGTPERPGLVLGLDKGGSCRGVVYRVAEPEWGTVLAYVRKRELVSGVYREDVRDVRIEKSGAVVSALTYVVDRQHSQYAGKLAVDDIARFVAQGHGLSGASKDYVENTLMALKEMGLEEKKLQSVLNKISAAS